MNLINFTPTFIFVIINLLVLYFILKKLLFKPVTQFMENRVKSIKDSIENADKNKAEAAELKSKYEEQLRTAKGEADKIINDAHLRASGEYDALINTARKDAEGILAKAREDIVREREQMMKAVKGQVAGLALAVASKVIEANMDTDRNKDLVKKFIDEVGAV